MAAPIKLNLKVYQGSTFNQVLRWESSTKVYVPITNVEKSAPVVITAPNHNVPIGWRIRVTNVGGMKEINSADYYIVTNTVDNNEIILNQVNALAYSTYTAGGIVEYNQPFDITGYTARMQIREKVTSQEVILELTTENGLIELNSTLNTIAITIPATVSQDFNYKSAVYSLELVKDGVVIPFAYGNVSLVTEVTR